jgi:putative addiction module component (TIGR02574 family)
MDVRGEAVLAEALKLPEDVRADIAHRLLDTLAPETEGWTEEELAEELQRRLNEARSDPSTTIPWSQLRDEA